MKKIVMMLCGLLSLQMAYGQNLIPNGDFEALNSFGYNPNGTMPNFFNQYVPNWSNGCPTSSGFQGSPDIFSTQNTVCNAKVPANAWANNMPVRVAGTKNYAGMWGGIEALRCGINQPLVANTTYTFSFYATRNQGHFNCSPTGGGPDGTELKVKVRLKKSTDPCNGGLDILTSQPITFGTWQNVTTSFTLTAAQVALGYDRIEFRTETNYSGTYFFMDDVTLYGPPPVPDFDFVTIGQTYTNVSTPYGPMQLTQVCASPAPTKTPVLINGSATINEYGYGIRIEPWNPVTWTGGPAIYDAWISTSGQVPSTDININNLSGVNMQPGQIYLVVLYVGQPTTYATGLFRINPLPAVNAGADQTLCNGLSASVNVTSSSWPVKVYNGVTLVGTYNSNPITLSPTSTTNYTFRATTPFGCSAQDQMTITVNTCSLASFVFKNPINTEQVPTPYGTEQVSWLCSPYKIDGSASTNENAYYFRIQEFNLSTWSDIGTPLYNGWYGTGAVGNDIDLYSVAQSAGNSFTYGSTYLVSLAVGPQWHSVTKFFKAIDCRKNGEVAFEEVVLENEVTVFPNPTTGAFTVTLDNVTAEHATITNVLGETVFSTDIPEDVQAMDLNLSDFPAGMYMIHIQQTNGETILKKIVKN